MSNKEHDCHKAGLCVRTLCVCVCGGVCPRTRGWEAAGPEGVSPSQDRFHSLPSLGHQAWDSPDLSPKTKIELPPQTRWESFIAQVGSWWDPGAPAKGKRLLLHLFRGFSLRQ